MKDSINKLLEDLLIVIVIYRMAISSTTSWKSLTTCLKIPCAVYLYDNSPEIQTPPSSRHQVIYRHDASNSGVSKAFNEGFKIARETGKNWLLLLDQDTELTYELFLAYDVAISSQPDASLFVPVLVDQIGIVSPFYYRNGITRRLRDVQKGVVSFDKKRTANSGSLITASAFELAGRYEERLPLDHSDIYFQEKLSEHFSSFVVVNAKLQHQFSDTTPGTAASAAARYRLFIESCITMSQLAGHTSNFIWVSLKRAVMLSFRFVSIRFVKLFFQAWLK